MRRLLLILVCGLAAAYLLSGVRLIRPGERAVVRRFGRVLDHQPAAGLYVGLPWGIDRIDRVPVTRVRRLEVGYQREDGEDSSITPPGQLLTGDHNLVDVRVVLHYAVDPDEDAIVHYVLQADRVDDVVARTVEASLAEWAAGRKIDDILIHGKAELPAELVEQVQRRVGPYRLGIRIHDASMAHLLPPEEVKEAFDNVTRAQTNIRTRVQDAQQAADRALRAAEEEQYRKEQDARAYADTQTRQARADAERFDRRRRQYDKLRRENPDVLTSIWWDEMGRLFAAMKQAGRIDLLDHHLGGDGLDITLVPPLPKRK